MAASVNEADPPQFDMFDEESMNIAYPMDSEYTRKQIKYGVSVFRDFCKDVNANFEDIDNKALDQLLSQFYARARNKKGELYSKKSMQAIRFGLQRHFMLSRGVDIVKRNEFFLSYRVFKALMVKLKTHGKASVRHHTPLTITDMTRIQANLNLNTADGLQDKVFLDVMLYFAYRSMKTIRGMRPEDFILCEEDGREFFKLKDINTSTSKSTNNHDENDDEDDDEEAEEELEEKSQRLVMRAVSGNPRCPVSSLKKYLSKLNPMCEWMWQRPKLRPEVSDDEHVWYANVPLGKCSLATMTKNISKAAGCSQHYTNHSLRATSVTVLGHHAMDASSNVGSSSVASSGHCSKSSAKNNVCRTETHRIKPSDTPSTKDTPSPVNNANFDQSWTADEADMGWTVTNVDDLPDSQLVDEMDESPSASPLQYGNTDSRRKSPKEEEDKEKVYVMTDNEKLRPKYIFNHCIVNIYE